MKTNFLKFIAIMLIFAGSFSACNKISELKNDNQVVNEPISLKNTKWKLVGFVDVVADTMKIAEPESEKCYILSFDNERTLSGVGCANTLSGNYDINYNTNNINILIWNTTEINHLFDEKLYLETLNIIQSFYVQGKELKLYYNDNKNYLLYKLIGGTNHEN